LILANKRTLQYNKEETELGEVLLLFSSQSFVFQFAFQICEDSNIQNQKLAWCFVSCESWFRQGRVFENRVLRKMFGAKNGGKVTRDWRKLHSEELNDFYSTRSIIRVIK